MSKVLVITTSLRAKSNSDRLAEELIRGAKDAGHEVEQISLKGKEIRSAVLMIHGDKAHSCYMSRDAYADMVKDSRYADNKELLIIPGASHTDLYDQTDIIPFDKIEAFMKENLK